jgi:septum formation protein
MRLILASTSPYRAQLLARLKLQFDCVAPRTDETPSPGEPAAALAVRLSLAKAQAVAANWPDALVIGADQVAELDGAPIGKPGDRAGAIAQLAALSGRRVTFHSGLALVRAAGAQREAVCIPTTVEFRKLTAKQIEDYVGREPAFDCAGSAKCEGLGIALLERVDGSDPTALIGLPLIALTGLLERFGHPVLARGGGA